MNNSSLFLSFFTGGKGIIPGKAEVIGDFDMERYLGKWYEIARLDHWFERGQTNSVAEYFLRPDGGMTVVNRGFLPKKNKWKKISGKE